MARATATEEPLSGSGVAPQAAGDRLRQWVRAAAPPVGSIAALLALWQLATILAGDPVLLPGPGQVVADMASELAAGELLYHLGVTLLRVVAAFLIAMTIGVAIGVAMGRLPGVDRWTHSWLVLALNVPALVTIVLCYIWIGLNEVAAVAAVAINKIPNVAVTLREGARTLDRGLFEMAQCFRFSRGRTYRHVVLPQLYPYIAASARSGLALIWKIVLVVELLGRSNGVGFQIALNFQLFDVSAILAYALSFVIVVQLIEWFILQPIERRVGRWRR